MLLFIRLLGAGFAGFWYHYGLWEGIADLEAYNYYCYSSGCLSLVLAALNRTVDDTYSTCQQIQTDWMEGRTSRYGMVQRFLDELITDDDVQRIQSFLANVNMLVSTQSEGVVAIQATTRDELVEGLLQTTWIPIVTGKGVYRQENGGHALDGGFSRVLHPACQYTARVPTTFVSFFHTFNPGMKKETVDLMYAMGRSTKHPFQRAT
jgi:hypothetical protein